MPITIAVGDLSGTGFLTTYAAVFGGLLIVAVLLRRPVNRSGSPATDLPQPTEVGLLVGGRARALYASWAGLRASGAAQQSADGWMSATGPLPPQATALDAIVYDSARSGANLFALTSDPRVRPALADMETRLVAMGWWYDRATRARARIGGFLLLGLAVIGPVGVIGSPPGAETDRAAAWILLVAILAAFVGIVFLVVPRISRPGQRALAEIVSRAAHLERAESPAWTTYGPADAALSAALSGPPPPPPPPPPPLMALADDSSAAAWHHALGVRKGG